LDTGFQSFVGKIWDIPKTQKLRTQKRKTFTSKAFLFLEEFYNCVANYNEN